MFHYKKDFLQISEFEHSDGREAETTSRLVKDVSGWKHLEPVLFALGSATKY